MNLEQLQFLATNKKIGFLIGAGVSASAGVPTFRGNGGHWVVGSKTYFPEELATYRSYSNMRDIVWGWYHHRRNSLKSIKPNTSHNVLNQLIESGVPVVNQNVDGFLKNSIEVHGNIFYGVCEKCKTKSIIEETTVDKCSVCDGEETIRPNILFFDECYKNDVMDAVYDGLKSIETLFIIGTTNKCHITDIMLSTIGRNCTVVEVNPEPTLPEAKFTFKMTSDEFLKHLVQYV